MADRKISDLTALTTPATGDLLPIVDVSEAAAADKNKKITVQELFKGVPDGTAAAPGLAFESDDGNGIYLAGTDTVAISTGGTQRLSVNASGLVTIAGDLQVEGSTTTIESTTVTIDDKNIELGSVDTPTDTTADGGGITLKGATDKTINWVNSTDAWTSSERFDFPAGTAAAPSIILNGDVNSGLYQPGADQVAISTGGTGRLFVNASGRVGIGTASPGQSLDIASGNANIGGLRVGGDNNQSIRMASGELGIATASANPIKFQVNSTEAARIDSSGRVLIGTTTEGESTADDLTVATSGHTGITIRSGTSSEGNIFFSDGTSGSDELRGAVRYYHSNNSLTFTSNATERMRIDSSGRLLVGASSDAGGFGASLQVRNDSGLNCELFRSNAASSGPYLALNKSRGSAASPAIVQSGDTVANVVFKGYDGVVYREAALISAAVDATPGSGDMPGRLIFSTTADAAASPTERMRIDSSGRVGINTTSPSSTLHINEGANKNLRFDGGITEIGSVTGFFALNDAGSALVPFGMRAEDIRFATGSAERVRIDSSGRLLVGTSSNSTNGSYSQYGLIQIEGNTSSGSGSAILTLRRGEAPGSITNNEDLGVISFASNNNNEFAWIRGQADGAAGTNDYPGRLVFSTTADGASSPTERVRIEQSGKTKFSGAVYGVENTITASAFNLNSGNLWTCGAIAIPNPTNAVAGLMGSIRVTAAPTSFGSNFDHPGGSYTAPTSFPAVAPFYCVSSTNILLGSWTEGIA